MKSVLSAFKGRKADSSGGANTNNGHPTNTSNTNKSNKSPINYENSYASLRQIRAADPFTKMSIASDDDLIEACIRVAAATASTPPVTISIGGDMSASSDDGGASSAECSSPSSASLNALHTRLGGLVGDVVTRLPPAKPSIHLDGGSLDADLISASVRMPVLSASDNNRLLKSGDLNTLRNSKSNSNRLSKRLSLTGIGNNLLPTVHGRVKTGAAGTTTNGTTEKTTKTRFSHQRNLSLDFRSMGVLLPPVPQTASAHINLTQHHRNRSLDSALQRIPEVEVASPTSEPKHSALCKNAFLSTGMCGKGHGQASPINSMCSASSSGGGGGGGSCSQIESHSDAVVDPISHCSSKDIDANIELKVHENVKKTAGDVSSLGSNDSGILCGSDHDTEPNFRSCRSRDSLESDETEAENVDKHSTAELSDASTDTSGMPIPLDLTNEHSCCPSRAISLEESDPECNDKPLDDHSTVTSDVDDAIATYEAVPVAMVAPTATAAMPPTPPEPTKGVITNIFGATKKVIFRTTQNIKSHRSSARVAAMTLAPHSNTETITDDVAASVQKTKADYPHQQPNEISPTLSPTATTPASSSSGTTTGSTTPTTTIIVVSDCNGGGDSGDATHTTGNSETTASVAITSMTRADKCQNGLLRFLESPIFNVHFALHYLFYSKEPGVLSFIGNKIFSFKDQDVDLYLPQLILMYIQMNELAEVLDPYLVYRCRRDADFCLKCLWLLEAYNYNADSFVVQNSCDKKTHLRLIRQFYPVNEQPQPLMHQQPQQQLASPLLNGTEAVREPMLVVDSLPVYIKTHHRSQSDATGLLNKLSLHNHVYTAPVQLCLGDLASGRAFDNGCRCFESVRNTVNDLRGQRTACTCRAPKLSPQKEFMKSLIDIGRNLTALPTKSEKNSVLRMRLNLINKNLPARVWLPLTSMPHHVVRIKEEKAAVLNSKDKTPYIIYVEVLEVQDTYTTPIIPKLMQTLRHTKSEEHLQSNCDGSHSDADDDDTAADGTRSPAATSSHFNPWLAQTFDTNGADSDIWSDDYECQKENLDGNSMQERPMKVTPADAKKSTDVFNIGDVRLRHSENLTSENTKPFFADPEDPSAAVLKEPWDEKEQQIRESSPYGHLSNWKLLGAIIKSGDDLRQELMATQLLEVFKLIWQEENVNLWVRPYKIVCLSNDSGLIEPILNTVSLHQIRKHSNKSLREYFVDEYGDADGEAFQAAQYNFMQSCAAYCLISYLLQVKDRHNGNILLHSDGHIIHIDFGFILSISPKNLGFEQSPFKLTPEFVDVIGGLDSELWRDFEYLLLKGVMAARKHMDRIINVVEIMRSSGQLPCFKNGCAGTVQNLRNRFHMNLTEQELARKMEQLVQDSLNSLSTKLYDGYQYLTNGIL